MKRIMKQGFLQSIMDKASILRASKLCRTFDFPDFPQLRHFRFIYILMCLQTIT